MVDLVRGGYVSNGSTLLSLNLWNTKIFGWLNRRAGRFFIQYLSSSLQVAVTCATPTSLSPGVRRAMATPRSRGGLMVTPSSVNTSSRCKL